MCSSDVRLSVIIPTIGRDTLDRAIHSCAGADQVIVIENQDGDHGYSARMRGMAQATGTHLCFLDDDDIYADGAIDLFKEAACERPAIFRMDHYAHGILWRDRNIGFGNVSTQMFVVPNQPEKLGVWEPHMPGLPEPGGDYTFLKGCADKMGEPVWRDELVAILRPEIPRPKLTPSITIVTAWKNNPQFEQNFFAAARCVKAELIVVDDHSDPPKPYAMPVGDRTGFSGCNNVGLEAATTDAVLFLNSDIVARQKDWIEPIRELLEPGVFVGAQLRYDPHGMVDGEPMPYIDGWCLAGMKDDLLELGGFDEDLIEHGYYADNDISFRARMAGITLKEARVPIVHLRDTKPPVQPSLHVREVTLRNKARFEARVRAELGVAA